MKLKDNYRAFCKITKRMVYTGDRYNLSSNKYTSYECKVTNVGILWTQPYNKETKTECKCGFYSDWDMDMINSYCDIMQSTGIKDIDGKLIYESDRVSHIKESNLTNQSTFTGEDIVKWNEDEGCFKLGSCGMIFKGYKIIGNIYE